MLAAFEAFLEARGWIADPLAEIPLYLRADGLIRLQFLFHRMEPESLRINLVEAGNWTLQKAWDIKAHKNAHLENCFKQVMNDIFVWERTRHWYKHDKAAP